MCSTPNPVESVFCVKCGARLAPLTAPPAPEKTPPAPPIKGLSLPAKPPTEEKAPPKVEPPAPSKETAPASGDESPGWLARLRTAAPADEEPVESAQPEPAPASDRSDWLARLRTIAPAEEETMPPDEHAAEPATEEASSASYPQGHVKDEDVPDWLKSGAAEPPTPETKPTEKPSWIQQLPATEPAEPAPASSEDKEPSWTSQMRAAEPAESSPASAEENEPSWVSQLRASAPADAPSAPTQETEPSWLRPLRAAASDQTPRAESPRDAAPDQMPPWLRLAQPSEPTLVPAQPIESFAPTEPEPAAPIEEPDWLKARVEEPAQANALASSEEAQAPDWLRLPVTAPTAPASMPPAVPAPVEIEETPSEELIESLEAMPALASATRAPSTSDEDDIPEWLRLAAPSGKPEPILGQTGAPAPSIEPVEVPDWIAALKPAEAVEAWAGGAIESEPVETAGPLSGMRGVLPLANAIAEPHVLSRPAAPADRRNGARIFEAILAAPSAPTVAPTAKRDRAAPLWRRLLYLLVVLAVVIPFVLPSDWSGASLPITRTPAAEFYDTLQALPANATVVLAFDYDPGASGEMDLLARALVRHLIQRRVKIIAVSTLELGPPIAQNILDDAARATPNYAYGANYLNAGLIAGHEAGLAQLAAVGFPATARDNRDNKPLGQFAVAANVKTLRDVALVIELAGTDDALKMWMDQVQPRGVKLAAGVSAGVEPKARAYRDAKQLVALMSGLVGAAQYEILASQSGLAVISVNAQSAAQLLFVLVIVVGNIMFWISRARSKAK